MASLPSFYGKSVFSSVRFLGVLKQPDASPDTNLTANSCHRTFPDGGGGGGGGDHHCLELDESDVVWTSASYDASEPHSPVGSAAPNSLFSTASTCHAASSLSPSGSYPHRARHHHHDRDRRDGRNFAPEMFGLSAALAEEPGPLVQQRKPAIDPSASATTAARTVPPVPMPKTGPGSDGHSAGSRRLFGQSAPVNVPVWPKKGLRRGEGGLDEVDEWGEEREWDGDEDGEMVPPHLIVARSQAMTFSVFEGVGRTLKGRDLRRVRNAVFRKTGFLD